MSVGAETFTIEEWLYAALTGDDAFSDALEAAGAPRDNVHAYEAPADAPTPFCVYSYNTGTDWATIGTGRVAVSALYLVKIVTEGPSFAAARPIVTAMDAALTGPGGAVEHGQVFGCRRESAVAYAENPGPGGRQFRHMGGLYRITAQ